MEDTIQVDRRKVDWELYNLFASKTERAVEFCIGVNEYSVSKTVRIFVTA